MNKMLTILFLLAVILLTPNIILAEEKNDGNTVTINEYEMLKELSKKDNSTLKLNGYNQTELNIIKNIEEEYPKHLKKYKDLPKEDLKKNGIY